MQWLMKSISVNCVNILCKIICKNNEILSIWKTSLEDGFFRQFLWTMYASGLMLAGETHFMNLFIYCFQILFNPSDPFRQGTDTIWCFPKNYRWKSHRGCPSILGRLNCPNLHKIFCFSWENAILTFLITLLIMTNELCMRASSYNYVFP